MSCLVVSLHIFKEVVSQRIFWLWAALSRKGCWRCCGCFPVKKIVVKWESLGCNPTLLYTEQNQPAGIHYEWATCEAVKQTCLHTSSHKPQILCRLPPTTLMPHKHIGICKYTNTQHNWCLQRESCPLLKSCRPLFAGITTQLGGLLLE